MPRTKSYERLPLTGGLNFDTGNCKVLQPSKSALADNHSESDHQIAFFDWVKNYENRFPDLELLHAIPNGGHRHIAVAVKLKKEGVKAGVWDVFLPVPKFEIRVAGLYIEMKAGKNKLTDEQKKWQELVQARNYQTAVCYSWIEAVKVLIEYLDLPLKLPPARG